MEKALLALVGVIGALMIARHILPGGSEKGSVIATSAPPQERKGNLTWFLDKEAAYRAAAVEGKHVFIDFHGDWCTNCKAFQEIVAKDAALNGALQRCVLLKVSDGSALFRSYRDDPRFPELKIGLPFFIITDADGNVIYKTSDYTRRDEMVLMLSG